MFVIMSMLKISSQIIKCSYHYEKKEEDLNKKKRKNAR
ncbi:hypothetical protein CHCC20335_0715 [Bacillus paralicheniformis]|nr:hypothetical protein CHCC20335_0715 [Bacillus paralicheniformis]